MFGPSEVSNVIHTLHTCYIGPVGNGLGTVGGSWHSLVL